MGQLRGHPIKPPSKGDGSKPINTIVGRLISRNSSCVGLHQNTRLLTHSQINLKHFEPSACALSQRFHPLRRPEVGHSSIEMSESSQRHGNSFAKRPRLCFCPEGEPKNSWISSPTLVVPPCQSLAQAPWRDITDHRGIGASLPTRLQANRLS